MTQIEPCGWLPDANCSSGPCCPDIDAFPVEEARAKRIAANLLWRLTGMRYGCCEITVRPCKPRTCDPTTLTDLIYFDQRGLGMGNLGVFNYSPQLIDGQVFNIACGCPTGCCKCASDCEVKLPGPVCGITSITVGGTQLNEGSDYQLYADGTVVFLTNCPPCQNYNLPLGQDGTWSITYTIGVPVPEELNYAAGLYACELAKGMVGDTSCGLPTRVARVARTGIDVDMFDPTVLANAGLTGIPTVDAIIRAINPYQLKQESYVWSIDTYRQRREA